MTAMPSRPCSDSSSHIAWSERPLTRRRAHALSVSRAMRSSRIDAASWNSSRLGVSTGMPSTSVTWCAGRYVVRWSPGTGAGGDPVGAAVGGVSRQQLEAREAARAQRRSSVRARGTARPTSTARHRV